MAIEAVRLTRHRPIVHRRILVPLVASDASEAAMALAAELAEDRGSTITAITVVEVAAELPLEAHMLEQELEAKWTLEDARAIGESRGVKVRTHVLRARLAGEAIVEEVERSRADLVVISAPRRKGRGRRRRIFGKTVDYVLKHAPCRVMVAAPPPPA